MTNLQVGDRVKTMTGLVGIVVRLNVNRILVQFARENWCWFQPDDLEPDTDTDTGLDEQARLAEVQAEINRITNNGMDNYLVEMDDHDTCRITDNHTGDELYVELGDLVAIATGSILKSVIRPVMADVVVTGNVADLSVNGATRYREAMERAAKVVGVEPYTDRSGYNFYKYRTESRVNSGDCR